jgi:hypothetical protein
MWWGHSGSAEGGGERSGKGAHSTKDGNPFGWHAHGRRARGQADHKGFPQTRACVALAQGLEGRPMLGELLRDTLLGRDDGLRGLVGLLVFGTLVVAYPW